MSPADSKTATFRTNALYELKVDTQPRRHGRHRLSRPLRRRDPRSPTAPGPRPTSSAARPARNAVAQHVERRRRRRRHAPPPTSTRVRTAPIEGGGAAFAGARDDPFFFDLPGFVEFKEQLLGGSTDLGDAARRLHRRGHLRRDQRPVDRAPDPERQARRHRQVDRRLGDDVRPVATAAGRQIDRMGRPAINTVFNGLLLPSSLGLQRPREGRLQLPAPDRGRRHHHGQRRRPCSTPSATC